MVWHLDPVKHTFVGTYTNFSWVCIYLCCNSTFFWATLGQWSRKQCLATFYKLLNRNSEWVVGRQFLIGGQAHPGREVLTTFEFWFKETSHVRQVYGGWMKRVLYSHLLQKSVYESFKSKRYLMGRSDQILIKDLNDSSNFKVFKRVSNLSNWIDLFFLILVLWMVRKTDTVWRSYRNLKSPVNYNFWTFDQD